MFYLFLKLKYIKQIENKSLIKKIKDIYINYHLEKTENFEFNFKIENLESNNLSEGENLYYKKKKTFFKNIELNLYLIYFWCISFLDVYKTKLNFQLKINIYNNIILYYYIYLFLIKDFWKINNELKIINLLLKKNKIYIIIWIIIYIIKLKWCKIKWKIKK